MKSQFKFVAMTVLMTLSLGCTTTVPVGAFSMVYRPAAPKNGIRLEARSEPVLDEDCINIYYVFPDKSGFDLDELVERACRNGALREVKLEQTVSQYFLYARNCLVISGLCSRLVSNR